MEEFKLVPPGMTPVDDTTSSNEETATESTEGANTEATTAETSAETTDKVGATTEETKTEANTDGEATTEEAPAVEAKVEDTTTETTQETKSTPEETTEDSSLHDEQVPYTFQDIVDDYDKSREEGDASIYELMLIKSEDLNSLSPTDLIEKALIYSTNDITDEELDVAIEEYDVLFASKEEKEQMIEDGEMSDRGFKVLEAKYNREAREAKTLLKKHQDSINLSDIIINNTANKSGEPKQTGMTDEQKSEVKADMTDSFKDYNKETLKVVSEKGDVLMEFDFDVNSEAKTEAIEHASDPNGLYGRWLKEDGTINYQSYLTDIVKLNNFDKMMKATYDQATSNNTEKIIKDTNNISETKTQTSKTGEDSKTAHDFLLNMRGSN